MDNNKRITANPSGHLANEYTSLAWIRTIMANMRFDLSGEIRSFYKRSFPGAQPVTGNTLRFAHFSNS
jgi:uncharacterized membrane protein YidH (DUF202 family)